MTDVQYDPVTIDPESHELFRFVEKPLYGPHYCVVTLAESDPRGFVDTGNEPAYAGPRIQISVAGIERLAKFIGFQAPEIEALRTELDSATARILDLEAEVEKADADLAAVDRLVRRQDGSWSKQARPGRKKGDTRVASNLPNVNRDED